MISSPPNLIPIGVQEDVVRARQAGREMARQLGFGAADQTRLATAISEIARNALKYAGSGTCEISAKQEPTSNSVKVTVTDEGPGIPDLDSAMGDGFTTGGGLGMGLPGAKRLVDDFEIESQPGQTKVTIIMKKTVG